MRKLKLWIAVVLVFFPALSIAQSAYPSRSVKMIIPFASFVAAETERWARVAKEAGATVD